VTGRRPKTLNMKTRSRDKAERPVSVRSRDLREDAGQRARRADSCRSLDERNRRGRPDTFAGATGIVPINNLWWPASITV